jgi:hypothetical protein
METKRCFSRWIPALLILAFLLGLAVAPAAADQETRYAFVINQTSDILVLRYDETVSGNKAMSAVQIYAGETKRLDTTKIVSDVCAWDAREGSLEPAKKMECRRLSPGDRWVIH